MTDWNSRYLEEHTPWDRGKPSPALFKWMEGGEPCSVIVPGCGRGHEVVELARRGYEVTALDLAPRALSILSEQLESEGLQATLVEGNVLEWSPEIPVQAVYEQTCFCAIEPKHWSKYAGQLCRWLQSGGVLVGSFMQTDQEGGPPYHCSIETMKDLLPASLWDWPAKEPLKIEHPRGDIHELMVVLERLP